MLHYFGEKIKESGKITNNNTQHCFRATESVSL